MSLFCNPSLYFCSIVSSFGVGGAGFGNFGAGLGSGFSSFGASTGFPSQCQFIADFVYGSNAAATVGTTAATGPTYGYQTTGGTGVVEQT